MHRETNATQFTALGPAEEVTGDDALAALYAYPDAAGPWLRVNFIAGLDGAIAIAGRSGGLGTPGDRRIFMLLRRLCDVVLVGAGTVRAEEYGGVRIPGPAREARAAAGLAPVPPVAIVTATGHLDPDHRVFHDTAVPPLVFAGRDADRARLDAIARTGAEIITLPAGPAGPDVAAIPGLLAGRGAGRILCEGGPGLVGRLLTGGAVDELCLTTAPLLVGGDGPRLAVDAVSAPTPMVRRHLLTDSSGALYARWTVA